MFEFLHFDLGHLPQGSVVEVALRNQAFVRIFDESNFGTYERTGQAVGNHVWATRSPHRVEVPRSGHWHLAIDLGGRAGQIHATINVLTPS